MVYLYRFVGYVLRSCYDFIAGIRTGDAHVLSNYALAIIAMAVIFKIVLMPLTIKQSKSMAKTQALSEQIKEIQKKYGNDTQTIARKQQELYKEAGVNPMSGCLPLLLQMPILIAMYRVVLMPTKFVFTEPGLYESINTSFFWIPDMKLADATMILPLLASVIQFFSSRLMRASMPQQSSGNKEQDAAMKQTNDMMSIVMPVMLFFMYRALPAAIPLYIGTNMLLSTLEQVFVKNRVVNRVKNEEN